MISQLDIIQAKIKSNDIATNSQLTQALNDLYSKMLGEISKRPLTNDVMNMIELGFTNFAGGKVYSIKDLDTLNTTYPQGHDGVFITLDTGHKWLWGPQGTWIDGGPYQKATFEDGDIKHDMQSANGRWYMMMGERNGKFNIDRVNESITWDDCYFTDGHGIIKVAAGYTALTNDNGWFMLNTVTKQIWFSPSGDIDIVPQTEQSGIFGALYADGSVQLFTNKKYSVDDGGIKYVPKAISTAHSRRGFIDMPNNAQINIDMSKNQLLLTLSDGALILHGDEMYFYDAQKENHSGSQWPNTFDISAVMPGGGFVLWDTVKHQFYGADRGATLKDSDVVVGVAWGNGDVHIDTNVDVLYNGYSSWRQNSIYSREIMAVMPDGGQFEVDTSVQPWKVTYPYHQLVLGDFYGIKMQPGSFELPMNVDGNKFGGILVYNRDSKTYKGLGMDDKMVARDNLIGYVYVDGSIYIHGSHTKPVIEKPVDDDDKFKVADKLKMVGYGDSIMWGYNGVEQAPMNYLDYIAGANHMIGAQFAVGGTSIMKNPDDSRSFDSQLTAHLNDAKDADIVLLNIGINDYNADVTTSMDDIKAKFSTQLDQIQSVATNATIYGVLPLPTWKANTNNGWIETKAETTQSKQGFTLDQLMDALKNVYSSKGIKALDWRNHPFINDKNYRAWLNNDDLLHPLNKTYERMGQIIEQFIFNN